MRLMELGLSASSEYSVEIKTEVPNNECNLPVTKNVKNRRKAAVPLRASPLGESSLGEESQTSQSSLEDNSNSADEEITSVESSNKTKDEYKSKSDIKCNMCEKLFEYKSEFDSHYQNTYNRTPVYTCLYCNRTMDKYATFRSHCYRHITEGRFKCEDCGQGFKLQSQLQVHISGKHAKLKPFCCEECGKQFATKSGLKIHVKRHLGEAKEQYTCAECGKILHTRGGLTSHMNVHRLGRRFMCDVCGKTFTQKVNMQQHVKQHTGDKPYECDICGKAFAEKSHLSRHNSFHTDDRPFKCEICDKMYKTERCLKVHRLVHGKERPYVCTYCNKGFLSSTKLKQHSNIHTGERPFACKYCERKFTNYPNWLKHTRRKHNVDHKTGKDLPPKYSHNLIETVELIIEAPNALNHYDHTLPIHNSNDNTIESIDPVKLEIKSEMSQKIEGDNDLHIGIDPHPESFICGEDYDDRSLDFIEFHEPIHHDNLTTDFKLSKHDELYLQKRILNFPMTDNEHI